MVEILLWDLRQLTTQYCEVQNRKWSNKLDRFWKIKYNGILSSKVEWGSDRQLVTGNIRNLHGFLAMLFPYYQTIQAHHFTVRLVKKEQFLVSPSLSLCVCVYDSVYVCVCVCVRRNLIVARVQFALVTIRIATYPLFIYLFILNPSILVSLWNNTNRWLTSADCVWNGFRRIKNDITYKPWYDEQNVHYAHHMIASVYGRNQPRG